MAARLAIKQIRSTIGRPMNQKRTIRALGIRRMNQVVLHDDNASIRGMVRKVQHLVSVRELEDG